MAYTLHVTGSEDIVTVKKAEQFRDETKNPICAGYYFGTWFCFTMKSAANKKADKELLAQYFPGALIETDKERKLRHSKI